MAQNTKCSHCGSARPWQKAIHDPDGTIHFTSGCCALTAQRKAQDLLSRAPKIIRSLTARRFTFAKIEQTLGWPEGTVRQGKTLGFTLAQAQALAAL